MSLRLAAVLGGVLVVLCLAACSDGGGDTDRPTAAPVDVSTRNILDEHPDDDLPGCIYCAPALEMRVGDAVLEGKQGSIKYSKGDLIMFGDAFAIITPTTVIEAPIGEDGVIVLPAGFTGTRGSVVVFEVVPEAEREATADCAGPATRGTWATCTGAIKLADHQAFDERTAQLESTELNLPLSELVSEPGEYVIALNAQIGNGDESWDGDFGFYLEAVES